MRPTEWPARRARALEAFGVLLDLFYDVHVHGHEPIEADDRLLTVRQAADKLGCHPATLVRHDLPCVRVGQQRRYRLRDVLAHLGAPAAVEQPATAPRLLSRSGAAA